MKSSMLRGIGGLISGGGTRARLSILIYHRVIERPDPLLGDTPDIVSFNRHLEIIRRYFCPLPLVDAVASLRAGTLPERALAVTFDDGYADNVEVALPALQRSGIPATFFIAAGFLDGGAMWNDRVVEALRHAPGPVLDLEHVGLGRHALGGIAERRAAAGALLSRLKYLVIDERLERVAEVEEACGGARCDGLMMTSAQLRSLHDAGMEIGGHTVNHPILARMPPEAARAEICGGKAMLEGIIGARVRLFAYPNGVPGRDYRVEHVDMVRAAGFEAAVSTAWGVASGSDDLYQLPRFTPWTDRTGRFLLHVWRNTWRGRPAALAGRMA